MRDYAAGACKSAIMAPIAAALPDEAAANLAFYYVVLAAPVLAPSAADGSTSYGAQLASFGNAEQAIPACVNSQGSEPVCPLSGDGTCALSGGVATRLARRIARRDARGRAKK